MTRWESSSRRREWVARLARYERWSGTVEAFCRGEHVSAPSFYQWRRRLAADVEPHRGAQRDPRQLEPPTFVPVQLMSAASATVEIELPNGAHVRLSAPEQQLLAAAIAAAGRVAAADSERSTSRGEAGRC